MTERERLVEIIKNSLHRHIGKSCRLAENLADDILADADVARVVRCPDCIYCKNMKCTELKDNTGHPLDVAVFDYCSQGVQKDEGSNRSG